MFLKRLEISGFKSFANKTVLDFSFFQDGRRGATAIVGPNGSGKSNVADAIRWVMGEQSMKNLRGKKSEDIIFAGSGKKARLGSAHVTLHLDNSDKKIPLEFEEVSIARKIFRSGESEYLINGSRVRLQDIVDLLAKAGIGKESYSVISQGMADAVLNATPLDRRAMIEEAAGVKQYQIKKERALKKLESTWENLARARELAEEIKPHLKMLKRQSEKASQGEVIAKELKVKQESLYSFLWKNFHDEKIKLDLAKEEMGVRMMNLQREVDKLADEINREAKKLARPDSGDLANSSLTELEKLQAQRRGQLNQLERDLIMAEGRIELEKEKQKNIAIIEEIRVKSIPVDLQYVKNGLDEIRREQERLIKRLEEAESLEDIQDIKEFARAIQQRLFELKSDIEKGKKEEASKETHSIGLEQAPKEEALPEVKADTAAIVEWREKILKIRGEIKNLEEELKKIGADVQVEIQRDRQERRKFFEMERVMRVKQDEHNRMKDQFNESKIALARVEVREEDLRAEVTRELKITVEELPASEESIDRYVLEKDVARLKVQVEQIGGIDPLVVEEYKETNARFEFLTKESDDLEKAIVSLKEIIKEMEQKINASFVSTFEEINKEFVKYFRIIFGGGNAHLTKVKIENRKLRKANLEGTEGEGVEEEVAEEDEEKTNEVGIDISASPPGKKISNLAMLSGGERSLTSLALLFAIISHNPPPFAVLDEVEAALDEANSRRFGRITQELSGNTQFVIITHNRETMRQANLMYGVTMGEDGISKLLSVRLDQVGRGGKILNR